MTNTAQTLKQTDDVNLSIGVNDESRKQVCEKLSGLLASTYMLYLKTLYYHWNVTGKSFLSLHELFETQYDDLHEAGDELAERIRALGHFTPGTVREFQELSTIKDDDSLPSSDDQMIKNLLADNEQCSKEAREVLKVAEEGSDEVTIDMMVARMTYHDKASWMLRSLLQ